MKFATVEFISGHKLVDNGVGDYDFVCPILDRQAFVHMGQVTALVSGAPCKCLACHGLIGAPAAGQPEPYTVATE